MDLDGSVCPECMPVVQAQNGEIESLRAWNQALLDDIESLRAGIAERKRTEEERNTGHAEAEGNCRC
jgi:hypothetical protein